MITKKKVFTKERRAKLIKNGRRRSECSFEVKEALFPSDEEAFALSER